MSARACALEMEVRCVRCDGLDGGRLGTADWDWDRYKYTLNGRRKRVRKQRIRIKIEDNHHCFTSLLKSFTLNSKTQVHVPKPQPQHNHNAFPTQLRCLILLLLLHHQHRRHRPRRQSLLVLQKIQDALAQKGLLHPKNKESLRRPDDRTRNS